MIRATAAFAAVSAVIIAAMGWMLTLAWPAPEARGAIVVSAGVAWVVQLFAFAAARLAPRDQAMAGWGIGVLVRLVVLVAYALIAPRALGMPAAPALLSLVSFFFVTSLVEPLLLRR
ncbi:MAG TPA: hypothetical protein VMT93_03610 [Gemmatimonadaceae bacterium]|nr:hypothetical protein [Gemmatimonadaceae bacterium]